MARVFVRITPLLGSSYMVQITQPGTYSYFTARAATVLVDADFNANYDAGSISGTIRTFLVGLVPLSSSNFSSDVEFTRNADFPADYVGTANADTLVGDADSNRLLALDGDDVLIGALGADALHGAGGNDTASYEFDAGAVFLNLTLGMGNGNAAEGDSFSSIENLRGTAFDDVLIGDGGSNRLEGLGGNDLLIGAVGSDVLAGGDGVDTASYEDNQGGVFVNLLTGLGFGNSAVGDTFTGVENLRGTMFLDGFVGDNGENILDGGAGDDTLVGGLGADTLIGGAGNDTASYIDNQGAVFVNLTLGQGFGNAAQGDTYSSIENLAGAAFSDTFIGDGNANRLAGGGGFDVLTGAGGADTFVFDAFLEVASNVDRITDFTGGSDKIELDDAIFTALAPGALSAAAFATGSATTAEHRIIYDQASGNLFYDADGSGEGAAILFATLEGAPLLNVADIVVV